MGFITEICLYPAALLGTRWCCYLCLISLVSGVFSLLKSSSSWCCLVNSSVKLTQSVCPHVLLLAASEAASILLLLLLISFTICWGIQLQIQPEEHKKLSFQKLSLLLSSCRSCLSGWLHFTYSTERLINVWMFEAQMWFRHCDYGVDVILSRLTKYTMQINVSQMDE